jgi:predicted RNA-binding protein with PUA-like domain
MQYWLFKSEPQEFSIEDLRRDKVAGWSGVRNYAARNMLRDQIRKDDLAFFYHSSCAEVGIVGTMTIVREGYPDHTAFDPDDEYYDPKSDPERPRWFMVDVQYESKLSRTITLAELKRHAELGDMPLLRRGNRLSVMSITKRQWDFILALQ